MNPHNQHLKYALQQFKDNLCTEFSNKSPITILTHKLATYIDDILIQLFHHYKLEHHNLCLIALGGYGRRELLLHSDIDLLFLYDEPASNSVLPIIEQLIQDCWDIGLTVGHQINTVIECAELAHQELSVISSLLDMHLLCGRKQLMDELMYQIHPIHMWPSHDYFFAKQREQNTRYKKYNETAYNLEPNIKYGPGGLRDLQIILAIGKRSFGIKRLSDGIHYGFITEKELEELMYCQNFLMSVRFALHMLTGKKEERLLFDYQIKLSALFDFKNNTQSLAIEQFMKSYFNIIKRTRGLNEMLLQGFAENMLHKHILPITILDEWFQLVNNCIDVRHTKVFQDHPPALIKLFLLLSQYPAINGVRAKTIRLVRQHLYLITEQFRTDSDINTLFMAILKTGNNPYDALQHMSRYGVLGHYLDSFSAVTGQMQYDLFHVYTVEQHTLFVIRNMGRFNTEEYAQTFALASHVMSNLPSHEILYLSGLFHDIAKGRGGDHSELGALDAEQFAKRHDLSSPDQKLLIWLVQNHLLMSKIIQRQDIYDPITIQHFCAKLPDIRHLDYLYLLTVADICATNPALWNAWKDSLLKELYLSTKKAMSGKQTLLNQTSIINARRQHALELLIKKGYLTETIHALWQHFKDNYFLHESPELIARHTMAILECNTFPLIIILPHHSQGGTEIFIYMPHCDERFTITTTILNNQHVTIQEANITICSNQFDLDTYVILDEKNHAFFDKQRIAIIHQALKEHLTNTTQIPMITQRRLSRTQAHFNLTPQITYSEDKAREYTCLFLVASDKPGLLAQISQIFLQLNIHLHSAKITTAGERVEDMFYITNHLGHRLNHQEQESLTTVLLKRLSNLNTDPSVCGSID